MDTGSDLWGPLMDFEWFLQTNRECYPVAHSATDLPHWTVYSAYTNFEGPANSTPPKLSNQEYTVHIYKKRNCSHWCKCTQLASGATSPEDSNRTQATCNYLHYWRVQNRSGLNHQPMNVHVCYENQHFPVPVLVIFSINFHAFPNIFTSLDDGVVILGTALLLTFVYPQCKCKPYSHQLLSPQKVTTPCWSRSFLGQ